MAYQIDRYNNTLLTTVEDGTVDQTTDLKFIGKNYAGYGEIQNENFLYLLENFSGTLAPQRPLSGQLWYDSANTKLKFYDGNAWKATGGATAAAAQPSGGTVGDFWWDSTNEQLYVYNGTSYILIGPQNAGEGLTQMQSLELIGTDNVTYSVIGATIEDSVVYIISPNEFTIDSSNAIAGFDSIKKGLTLKWTMAADLGVTNSAEVTGRDFEYHGTASNALRLGGNLASDFVLATSPAFTGTTNFPSEGVALGDNNELQLNVDASGNGIMQNAYGSLSNLIFKTTNGLGQLIEIDRMNSIGFLPGADNTFDIGFNDGTTDTRRWKDVHAVNFRGIADKSDQLKYAADSYAPGSQVLSNNTVAVRTADGNLAANLFQGTATSARYADLAEKYSTAEELAPGTVVCVGRGEAEVQPVNSGCIAIGVVSTDPAVMMNSDADGQYIGLKGRLPVRVVGAVAKGDAVYVNDNGCAGTAINGGSLVGVALESNSYEGEKLVECVLKV